MQPYTVFTAAAYTRPMPKLALSQLSEDFKTNEIRQRHINVSRARAKTVSR